MRLSVVLDAADLLGLVDMNREMRPLSANTMERLNGAAGPALVRTPAADRMP